MDEIEDKDYPWAIALNEEYGWECIRTFPRYRIVIFKYLFGNKYLNII